MIKKSVAIFLLGVMPGLAMASGGGEFDLMPANNDLHDKVSLQSGARLFVNYCLSCHSAGYMRYNRMGKDLGISDDMVKKNMMFASDKIGSLMKVAMSSDDAEAFFGTAPPDLTVVARSRGVDWLYTYLTTFYKDESRPFGVNNAVFPNVGMPHVLVGLQGEQRPVYEEHHTEDGGTREVLVGVEPLTEGSMTAEEYRLAVRDLVNFLDYMGEPAKLERRRLGVWVLAFLVIAFFVTYALKKEYWKDVH
jgi:ubiquinol-cytochrome c reductase cytochrome c1 subunit